MHSASPVEAVPPLIRPMELTPEKIGAIYRKFWEHRSVAPMGAGHDKPENFVQTITSPDAVVFEVGDFGGVVIVTDIRPTEEGAEGVARPHILVWDRKYYRKADEFRAAALRFMEEVPIHRLIVELPAGADRPRRFAETIGFHLVGTFRGRLRPRDGKRIDTILYDALVEDLKGQANGR